MKGELPPLSAELEGELRKLTPTRPRRPARRLAIVVSLALLSTLLWLLLFGARRDLGELPTGYVVGIGALWLVVAAVLIGVAALPGRGDMLGRARLAGILGLVASVFMVAVGILISARGPSSGTFVGNFWSGHSCFEVGALISVIPVGLGVLALRRTAPVNSRWLAIGIGAAGGSLGGLALHLHCRIADPWHVGILHGSLVGVAALITVLAAPRALRP